MMGAIMAGWLIAGALIIWVTPAIERVAQALEKIAADHNK